MAEGRREWMVQMMDMWNAGEYESILHELGPDLVFSPDPSFPDAGEYRGEEFRRWMRAVFFDHDRALDLARSGTG